MDAPVETELKLVASPAMLAALREHPRLAGEDRTGTWVTTYFDTPGRSLQRSDAVLRRRAGPGGTEQTLKLAVAGAPCIARAEWTVPSTADLPVAAHFPPEARAALELLLGDGQPAAFAISTIERTVRTLRVGSTVIELAFDRGTIAARGRECAVCELEFELKAGSGADLFALALALPLGPDLRWSSESKAARAQALAYDLPVAARRAEPVRLPPEPPVADGLRAIGWNGLQHLLANYPLVIATRDPEAVHQTRVAIRRLRAALSLFAPAVTGPAGPVFRAQLQAAASGLAGARERHLLHDRVAAAAGSGRYDYAALLARLSENRDIALAEARHVLAGESFQRLLLQFAGWLEGGDWPAGEKVANRPLEPFAARVLTRQFGKVRKATDPLADEPERALHALRIKIKKLRYAGEFFAPLYPVAKTERRRHRFSRTLVRLQDSLGALNDLACAEAAPAVLAGGSDPIVAAGLAAELEGLLHRGRGKARRRLLRTAQRALDRLGTTAPWWQAD